MNIQRKPTKTHAHWSGDDCNLLLLIFPLKLRDCSCCGVWLPICFLQGGCCTFLHPCAICFAAVAMKKKSYFNLLQIRWVMKTSVTHVCYFSGSSFILVPCSRSWLGCFCCSFQGPCSLSQDTTFLVQGFLSWAFSWCHNLVTYLIQQILKEKVMCFATPQVFLSPLVAVFKTAGISLGFCFQRFFLL